MFLEKYDHQKQIKDHFSVNIQLFQAEFIVLFEYRSLAKLILHEPGRSAGKLSLINKRTAENMTKAMIQLQNSTLKKWLTII